MHPQTGAAYLTMCLALADNEDPHVMFALDAVRRAVFIFSAVFTWTNLLVVVATGNGSIGFSSTHNQHSFGRTSFDCRDRGNC